MDTQEQQTLWAIAVEHYEAGQLTTQHGWHNVSVACSYYAVYTVMWLVLDNPPRGQWTHAGILQHFAPGRWRSPATPLERTLTRAIRRLYNTRVRAQYMGERLTRLESAEGLSTARQVLQLVAMTLGFSFAGSTP